MPSPNLLPSENIPCKLIDKSIRPQMAGIIKWSQSNISLSVPILFAHANNTPINNCQSYIIRLLFQPNYDSIAQHCNLWRNWDDIEDSWASLKGIIDWFGDNQDRFAGRAGPGNWNDPDMVSDYTSTRFVSRDFFFDNPIFFSFNFYVCCQQMALYRSRRLCGLLFIYINSFYDIWDNFR